MQHFVGTSTTFRATHALVAILTNNPELQKRLQREVDEAIGEETPRLADKEKMPYMEAVSFRIFPLLISLFCNYASPAPYFSFRRKEYHYKDFGYFATM